MLWFISSLDLLIPECLATGKGFRRVPTAAGFRPPPSHTKPPFLHCCHNINILLMTMPNRNFKSHWFALFIDIMCTHLILIIVAHRGINILRRNKTTLDFDQILFNFHDSNYRYKLHQPYIEGFESRAFKTFFRWDIALRKIDNYWRTGDQRSHIALNSKCAWGMLQIMLFRKHDTYWYWAYIPSINQ